MQVSLNNLDIWELFRINVHKNDFNLQLLSTSAINFIFSFAHQSARSSIFLWKMRSYNLRMLLKCTEEHVLIKLYKIWRTKRVENIDYLHSVFACVMIMLLPCFHLLCTALELYLR